MYSFLLHFNFKEKNQFLGFNKNNFIFILIVIVIKFNMNQCIYLLSKGKRKGEKCGKKTPEYSSFCLLHSKINYYDRNNKMSSNNNINNNIIPNKITIIKRRNSEPHNITLLINQAQTKNSCINAIQNKINNLNCQSDQTKEIIKKRFEGIITLDSNSSEFHKNKLWLNYALDIPWDIIKPLPINIKKNTKKEISTYLIKSKEFLNEKIFGMNNVKEEIITFICKNISNPYSNKHILALKSPPGCGKNSIISCLSECLGLPLYAISLGGKTDSSYFLGHNYTYVESSPGRIVQLLIEAKCKNFILYFDELDKISETNSGRDISNVLIHLTDYTQNHCFHDNYLQGLDIDCSQIFYIFSFNYSDKINKILKDRLKIINIIPPSITDKIIIAKQYLLPEIIKNFNYPLPIQIDDDIIKYIINKYTKEEGVRDLYRCLETILSKLNVFRFLVDEDKCKMDFYIEVIDHRITEKAVDKFLYTYKIDSDDYNISTLMYL
jgi:ATP-dependent Lon protease